MKRFLSVLVSICLILFISSLISCSYGIQELFGRPDDVDERSSTLKILQSSETPSTANPNDSFNILVFSDVHFGKSDRCANEDKLIEWIQNSQSDVSKSPLFCLCLGDVADHGKEDEYLQYKDFIERMYAVTGVETYTTVGNHDLYNSGWSNYIKYVFPYSSFYKFETDRFSFYSIDTASGCVGKVQYNALKEAFKYDSKKKIVFTHFPLYGEGDFYFRLQDMTERNLLIALFAENNVAVCVSGHTHANLSTDFRAFYDLNYYALCKSGKAVLLHINQQTQSVTWEEISL